MARKRTKDITIRSSAAEYLTYVVATGEAGHDFDLRYEDENLWVTQKMMAELYGVEVPTINEHTSKVFSDFELDEQATIRKFRIVQSLIKRWVRHVW